MGILDDAIRQHLDLKRQRGATESELKELEDEAFGPPSRPGEPDFPGEESHDQNGNGSGAETAVSEPEATLDAGPLEPSSEAEPSAGEHPVVESPPAVEDEPQAAEPTPASEELTTIYDHTEDGEPDVEDAVEVEEAEPDSAPPIESLDTVEHSLPEEAVEPESPPAEEPGPDPGDEAVPAIDEQEEPPSEEEPHLDQEADEDEGDEEDEEDEEDEDVLADTPEFLKDAPEDDELWFEQGKPKDFDF